MTWPAPTRADHEKLCQTERWQPVRDARGRTGTHDVTYELVVHDGRILRTRISHPVDRSSYGQNIWRHILKDQLDVDHATFWGACETASSQIGERRIACRSVARRPVNLLLKRVGLSEPEVAAMTRTEAITRMQQFWALAE